MCSEEKLNGLIIVPSEIQTCIAAAGVFFAEDPGSEDPTIDGLIH